MRLRPPCCFGCTACSGSHHGIPLLQAQPRSAAEACLLATADNAQLSQHHFTALEGDSMRCLHCISFRSSLSHTRHKHHLRYQDVKDRHLCRVQSVEHLLSSLEQCGVDNARIEIEGGDEVPIIDGSALGWAINIQVVRLGLPVLV